MGKRGDFWVLWTKLITSRGAKNFSLKKNDQLLGKIPISFGHHVTSRGIMWLEEASRDITCCCCVLKLFHKRWAIRCCWSFELIFSANNFGRNFSGDWNWSGYFRDVFELRRDAPANDAPGLRRRTFGSLKKFPKIFSEIFRNFFQKITLDSASGPKSPNAKRHWTFASGRNLNPTAVRKCFGRSLLPANDGPNWMGDNRWA